MIGLPNRHNVLFDQSAGRLVAWWLGDAARQQTRGKSWYWEAGVPQLMAHTPRQPAADLAELTLIDHDRRIAPTPDGDDVTQFDWFEHADGGVRFAHRLRFRIDEMNLAIGVAQHFTPLANQPAPVGSGFGRHVALSSLHPALRPNC